ncbi:MAG TPA: hypothetical protein VM077_03615 [Candidatus Limnocylindrales bacterium]|nr:hypothetical protein [Candidatus Limnocylindrales bacterium]
MRNEQVPLEVLRVATDTRWHDQVAEVMNKRRPGAVTVFEATDDQPKGYSYPVESPFRALTRAAQNFDTALEAITPDADARAIEVRKAIKKVYKDQTKKRFGRRRGK